MTKTFCTRRDSLLWAGAALGLVLAHPARAAALAPVPARLSPVATRASLLGLAWAGQRAVAVGDHGMVLLSDDQGLHWRQAASVPVSSLLTSVCFADAQRGWAVGHGGAILATQDGGEHWAVQRLALEEDRPLFSVHCVDGQRVVAAGLWSLMLATDDGGSHWSERSLPVPQGARKADANLLQLFASPQGVLFAAAERGLVLRSADRGDTWSYLSTGFKGSLWCGLALGDGSLLVGGQRGALFRSADGGQRWDRLALDSQNSLTALVAGPGQQVLALGLDGLAAMSRDGGQQFTLQARPGRVGYTAALARPDAPGAWLVVARTGVQAAW